LLVIKQELKYKNMISLTFLTIKQVYE